MAEPEVKNEITEKVKVAEVFSKKKAFVCKFEECGKRFIDPNQFKEHTLSHGEKQVI